MEIIQIDLFKEVKILIVYNYYNILHELLNINMTKYYVYQEIDQNEVINAANF